MPNACQRCGACCALYKVTLQCSETSDQPGGTVPLELTVHCGVHSRVMKGTERFRKKRCIALSGNIGDNVTCLLYGQRPVACRDFLAGWEIANGDNPLCDRARAIYGMVPFRSF